MFVHAKGRIVKAMFTILMALSYGLVASASVLPTYLAQLTDSDNDLTAFDDNLTVSASDLTGADNMTDPGTQAVGIISIYSPFINQINYA